MEKKVLTVQETFEEMESIQLGSFTNPVHREFINDTLIEAQKCEAVRTELARQLTALKVAYDEEMQATGMSELFEQLKNWNQRVCDKVIERDEAKVGMGVGRMANARKASDEAWRELRRAVNAYAYVNGYEPYAEFIGYMNVLIIRYKRTHLGQQAESPEAGGGGTTGGGNGENNGGTTNTPNPPVEEDWDTDDDFGFDEDL